MTTWDGGSTWRRGASVVVLLCEADSCGSAARGASVAAATSPLASLPTLAGWQSAFGVNGSVGPRAAGARAREKVVSGLSRAAEMGQGRRGEVVLAAGVAGAAALVGGGGGKLGHQQLRGGDPPH